MSAADSEVAPRTEDPGPGADRSGPDASGTAGPQHVLDPSDRQMTLLARAGIAYLLYWLVILLLLALAVTSLLRAPGGSAVVRLVSASLCVLWAMFCLAMGVLRGSEPDGRDLPPPVWLPVITTAGCLISLAIARGSSVYGGPPWPAEVVVGGLLVASMTVWLGVVGGAAAGITLALLLLVDPLLSPRAPRFALSSAIQGLSVLLVGFVLALALTWLQRSAAALQRSLDAKDDLLVREQAVASAAQLAAEVERSLHDTALNTLETIAAHGDHLDRSVVMARCEADVAALSGWRSQAGLVDLGEVVDHLDGHARRLGLRLDTWGPGPDPGLEAPRPAGTPVRVPPPVLHAVAGAATEALTNVAKHAGVTRASLVIVHDDRSLTLRVVDEGAGPGDLEAGFGLRRSVTERMAAVGGTAEVRPGPGDRGTEVLLDWRPTPEELPPIAADLLVRVAGVAVAVGTALAGVGCALAVLGWGDYAHPAGAALAPLLSVLVAASLLNAARAGRAIGPRSVAVACATYVLVAWMGSPAADSCPAAVGEGVLLDARAPLVIVVLLLAPRPRVLAALLATVAGTHAFAVMGWTHQWLGCGPQAASAGLYVSAALVAVWLFALWIDRVAARYAQTRAQARALQIRIQARLAIRAEDEVWVADTLAAAQGLLTDIASGTLLPADPGTRQRCAAQAQFLRALLTVGGAPIDLRDSVRAWLAELHRAGCPIQVRGTFPQRVPPAATLAELGTSLALVAELAAGAAVTLTTWSDPDAATLVVTVVGSAVTDAGSALADRIQASAPSAWIDLGADALTLEWTWTGSANVDHETVRLA